MSNMTNASKEMLELLHGREIRCAKVTTDRGWGEKDDSRTVILKDGHDEADYLKFLNALNFEYYSGFGGQELFGTVWFEDNSWAERGEYDGSEWWEVRCLPDIPKELLP